MLHEGDNKHNENTRLSEKGSKLYIIYFTIQ